MQNEVALTTETRLRVKRKINFILYSLTAVHVIALTSQVKKMDFLNIQFKF